MCISLAKSFMIINGVMQLKIYSVCPSLPYLYYFVSAILNRNTVSEALCGLGAKMYVPYTAI